MPPASILFVGYREPALRAATRLGLRAFVVDERLPGTGRRKLAAGWGQADLADAGACLAAARAALDGESPARVLAMVERGVVPAALLRQALGVRGTEPAIARICHDKMEMKRALAGAGLPVTDWLEVTPASTVEGLVERLGMPLVLKPRDLSGARGLVIARTREEAAAGLRPGLVAERFIHGVEMSVESFRRGGRTLFASPTRYHVPLWASIVPAPLEAEMLRLVREFNDRALAALGIRRGLTHLELYLTAAGPVVGEVAVRPPGGYLMRLMELAYGFDPWEALLRIVVLGEAVRFPEAATRFAGARILHPGPGEVERVEGLAALRARAGVVEAAVRVRRGSRLGPRLGTGQEAGHVIAAGAGWQEVTAILDDAPEALRFRLRSGPE